MAPLQKTTGVFTPHCLIDLEALFAVTLSYERVSHVRQAGYRQRRRHLLELFF
ncbi:MAG: hypothetical protein PVG70_07575 [Desulfobacterales bacterium]